MRRSLAAFILVLLWARNAFADSPIPPHNWERIVGSHRFVMLSPYDRTPQASAERPYPAAGLYRGTDSQEPLWTIDWYAHEEEVFLSANGDYLARLGPWPLGGNFNELAVAFYRNGSLTKAYLVRDLVRNPETLPQSESHYTWHRAVSYDPIQLRLEVVTTPGITYLFDVTTGDILSPTGGATGQAGQADHAAEPRSEARLVVRISAILWAVVGVSLVGGIWILVRRRR